MSNKYFEKYIFGADIIYSSDAKDFKEGGGDSNNFSMGMTNTLLEYTQKGRRDEAKYSLAPWADVSDSYSGWQGKEGGFCGKSLNQ